MARKAGYAGTARYAQKYTGDTSKAMGLDGFLLLSTVS